MTRKKQINDAIKYLEGIWGDYGRHERYTKIVVDYINQLETKISEQAPADAVSRADAIEVVDHMLMGERNHKIVALEELKQLPSVQPKQKVGEWIEDDSDDFLWKCSECGKRPGFTKYIKPNYNYCPYCGIRLINKEKILNVNQ